MKNLLPLVALAAISLPAYAASSAVKVKPSANDKANEEVEITGAAADQLFELLSDDLMDSTDAESPKGRPVWKTGKHIVCTKYVMGKQKVPTACSLELKKASGEAVDLQPR